MEFAQQSYPVLFFIISIWTLFWKGIALWRAATLRQRNWFIAMLILNTMGILEIVYLFRFAEKKLTIDEMKRWRISPKTK